MRNINEQIDRFDDSKDAHSRSVDDIDVYATAEDDLTTCFDCCNNTNYCNRDLCDYGSQG